jgi:FAD binding domain-containing protein
MSEAIDPAGAGDGLTELRRSVGGAVLAPTDEGFDAARRCFNTLVDHRPAVIVRCLDAGDVARAFDFARAHVLEVAVRGGGHNPAGHCVCEGGLAGRPGRMPLTGRQRQADLGGVGWAAIGRVSALWSRLGTAQRRWRGCARGR